MTDMDSDISVIFGSLVIMDVSLKNSWWIVLQDKSPWVWGKELRTTSGIINFII